ncbi:MAG: c-type cytochrome, partial [Planctomycetaceae bacterium]|nr:c-type cytochrome [Planctomycetaceae bacterium]
QLVASTGSNENAQSDVRLLATKLLRTWNTPQQTDTVTGRWRPLPNREVAGLAEAVQPYLAGMLAGSKQLREEAIALAADLGIRDIVPTLQTILENADAAEDERVVAFQALSELLPDVRDLLRKGQRDSSEQVRIAALRLQSDRDPQAALPVLAEIVNSGTTGARQVALQLLGQLKSELKIKELRHAFDLLKAERLPNAVVLDLLNAAEATNNSELAAMVAAYREQQQAAGTKLAEYSECLDGGNAAKGSEIFFGRAAASCRRCHKVNGNGADIGPDLSAIAKDKDRSYLLESIVDPNAKIAKNFETTIIVDLDGRIHSGIIREETDDVVRLVTPQGAIVSVAKSDIDERAKGQSGMPADIAKNLSRSEIRDLVEYLSTLKQAVGTAHGSTTAE